MSVNQVNLPNVKFKNNLSKHNIVYSLIEQISEKIKLIPQHEKLRTEIELVKTCCNIVENLVQRKNKKQKQPINKKQLVVDALSIVFNYSEPEKELVFSLIDYLFNNDQIKRFSYYKLSKQFLSSIIQTKNK
jgi:hypothetical protein